MIGHRITVRAARFERVEVTFVDRDAVAVLPAVDRVVRVFVRDKGVGHAFDHFALVFRSVVYAELLVLRVGSREGRFAPRPRSSFKVTVAVHHVLRNARVFHDDAVRVHLRRVAAVVARFFAVSACKFNKFAVFQIVYNVIAFVPGRRRVFLGNGSAAKIALLIVVLVLVFAAHVTRASIEHHVAAVFDALGY